MPELALRPIGVVRSARTSTADTPVQAALNPDEEAAIELSPDYVEAILDLDGFDYLWLLTWLGGAQPEPIPPLRQVPYLLSAAPREIGVLATRGPRRINPIGLSLVRLVAVDGATVRFAGVDLVDGTPVIDIKPFVEAFDRPPTGPVRCGWFDTTTLPARATPRQLAQPPDL